MPSADSFWAGMTDIIIDLDTKDDCLHYSSVPRQTDHWRGAAVTAGGHTCFSRRCERKIIVSEPSPHKSRRLAPAGCVGPHHVFRARLSPKDAYAVLCTSISLLDSSGSMARRPCSAGAFGESWPQLLTLSLPLKRIIRRCLIERAPHVDVACLRDAALNVDRGARLPASRPQPEVGRDVARAAEPRGSSIAVHERKRRHRTDAGDERSARTVVTHSSIGRTEHRNRARSGCLIVGAAAGRITWFSRSWFASVLIRRSGSPCSDGVRQRADAMRFICRRTAHQCAPSSLQSLTWARRVASASLAAASPT